MPIKTTEMLSRADFDEAVVRLRLNVSEIAKEVGIPRTYLSEFRNGDRKLRPEHQGKLRDYFEAKGVEFETTPAPQSGPRPSGVASRDARVVSIQDVRRYVATSNNMTDESAARVMDVIDDVDARLRVLLKVPAKKPFFTLDDDWASETQDALDEATALLAGNYIVFRMLCAWNALTSKPSIAEPKTVRDVLFATYKDRLIEAGLIAPDDADEAANDTQSKQSEEEEETSS